MMQAWMWLKISESCKKIVSLGNNNNNNNNDNTDNSRTDDDDDDVK